MIRARVPEALVVAGIEAYEREEQVERQHFFATAHGGRPQARHQPGRPVDLALRGQAQRVTVVREFSSYTWWLKEQVQARSDRSGNVASLYDFVYLDGAKNWTIDGLAVILIEKLLRPGGWLLMDDLEWTYAQDPDREATALRKRSRVRSGWRRGTMPCTISKSTSKRRRAHSSRGSQVRA